MNKTAYWMGLCTRRLEDANVLYASWRYDMMTAVCCMAIECAMKGYFEAHQDAQIPQTHNLVTLAKSAGLWEKLDDEQRSLLETILPYYSMALYPEDIDVMLTRLDATNSEVLFEKTIVICNYIRGEVF